MISFKDKINQVGIHAKEASKILAKIPTKQKNEALLAMADHILKLAISFRVADIDSSVYQNRLLID